MNRFITLLVIGAFIAPVTGCSNLTKCLRGERTQLPVLDEQLRPVTTVEVKGKFGGDYAMVPREILETTATIRPTPAKKSSAAATRQPQAPSQQTQDDKMYISWDGASRIRIRCQQHFAVADVFPGRGSDRHRFTPEVTEDGYIDPEVVGPIIEKVRAQNQALLAANPTISEDDLELVCFNYHSPKGERYEEHLTNDGQWAMVGPKSGQPGGRVILSRVKIVGEVAKNAEFGHQIGERIHAFAVIPY